MTRSTPSQFMAHAASGASSPLASSLIPNTRQWDGWRSSLGPISLLLRPSTRASFMEEACSLLLSLWLSSSRSRGSPVSPPSFSGAFAWVASFECRRRWRWRAWTYRSTAAPLTTTARPKPVVTSTVIEEPVWATPLLPKPISVPRNDGQTVLPYCGAMRASSTPLRDSPFYVYGALYTLAAILLACLGVCVVSVVLCPSKAQACYLHEHPISIGGVVAWHVCWCT
mmetsp:Transcript_379/g.982  ORF Transcript_379/g.982 Transcript_379/m.982 type:complete len:226 (-) Transcript_379:133-810(-)